MVDALDPGAQHIVDDEVEMAARVGRRIAKSLADGIAGGARGTKRVAHAADLVALRDQIAEARNEDVPALLAAMIQTAGVASVGGPRAVGSVDPRAPYFGHMRLDEGGRRRDVLVGKRGMIDREAGVVIVDWRDAPVSRLYYRYEEGDEYEEELGDKLREGTVLLRRTVTFVDGDLARVRCPSGTFVRRPGDPGWRALAAREAPELVGGVGKAERAPAQPRAGARERLGFGDAHLRTDKHLPEITALIDAAQFDAMTKADSGLVVLQGGAGSGKTTVALHRVAYLAFAAPDAFRPQQMIIVVAQPQLARYVERLLPALDVPGVKVFAHLDWTKAAVERLFGVAGKRRRPGTVLGRRLLEDTPPDVARTKKHPRMLAAIDAQWRRKLAALKDRVREIVDDAPAGETLEDVRAWFARLAAARAGSARAGSARAGSARADSARGDAAAVERARKIVEPFLESGADVVAEWEELITDRALLAMTEVDEQTLAATLRHTKRQIEEPDDDSDIDDEHKQPVDDAGPDPDDPQQAFDVHDLSLLLAMWIRRTGGLGPLAYDHVVVDEAQDLSALELMPLLVATGERASITLAGDVVQKVVFDTGYDDWPELERQLAPYLGGKGALSVEPFRLSYRSTAEVVAFGAAVLGPLAPRDPPRAVRTGAPVEVFAFADAGEEIAFLADSLRSLMAREPQASVALLCRYPERARFYAEMLDKAEVPRLRLVLGARGNSAAHDDFSFTPGVDVTHTSRVKGLEYDYVILAEVTDAMYPDQIAARHLLHIGATRAAHQLWITTSTDAPSPLLPTTLVERALAG